MEIIRKQISLDNCKSHKPGLWPFVDSVTGESGTTADTNYGHFACDLESRETKKVIRYLDIIRKYNEIKEIIRTAIYCKAENNVLKICEDKIIIDFNGNEINCGNECSDKNKPFDYIPLDVNLFFKNNKNEFIPSNTGIIKNGNYYILIENIELYNKNENWGINKKLSTLTKGGGFTFIKYVEDNIINSNKALNIFKTVTPTVDIPILLEQETIPETMYYPYEYTYSGRITEVIINGEKFSGIIGEDIVEFKYPEDINNKVLGNKNILGNNISTHTGNNISNVKNILGDNINTKISDMDLCVFDNSIVYNKSRAKILGVSNCKCNYGDSDFNNIPDAFKCGVDRDGSGIHDEYDAPSSDKDVNENGVYDLYECGIDTNENGLDDSFEDMCPLYNDCPTYCLAICDDSPCQCNSEPCPYHGNISDCKCNYGDKDFNNIPDIFECGTDRDGTGIHDEYDTVCRGDEYKDSNDNGVYDLYECGIDTNENGLNDKFEEMCPLYNYCDGNCNCDHCSCDGYCSCNTQCQCDGTYCNCDNCICDGGYCNCDHCSCDGVNNIPCSCDGTVCSDNQCACDSSYCSNDVINNSCIKDKNCSVFCDNDCFVFEYDLCVYDYSIANSYRVFVDNPIEVESKLNMLIHHSSVNINEEFLGIIKAYKNEINVSIDFENKKDIIVETGQLMVYNNGILTPVYDKNINNYRRVPFESCISENNFSNLKNGDYFLVQYINDENNPVKIPFILNEPLNITTYDNGIQSCDAVVDIIYDYNSKYVEITYIMGATLENNNIKKDSGICYKEKLKLITGVMKTFMDGYECDIFYEKIDFNTNLKNIYKEKLNRSVNVNMTNIIGMNCDNFSTTKNGNKPLLFTRENDNLSSFPKTDFNIVFNRGNAAGWEKHFKLSECNTMQDLMNYGNNFFNL